MTPDFQSLYQSLKHQTNEAVAAGWLQKDAPERLNSIEQLHVSELFRQHPHRPLIVGLFGGTGVGKSSLLNRLAGEEIAQAGVERPTSHEVTLYLHKDFRLDLLPADLPMKETRIAYHSKPERRLIAWLDMPDIDSTATHNREIVKAWLPYVDWIIYVVSPERYFDDIGWRFLQERAGRHAWLFVMNHWDQGREEQIDDLRRRLEAEGFKNPTILRTIGVPSNQPDDFDKLEKIINDAINRYGLDILQQLGIQARNRDLQQLAKRFSDELGNDSNWSDAEKEWQTTITEQLDNIDTHLQTQADALTQSFMIKTANKPTGLLARFKGTNEAVVPAPAEADQLIRSLWDQRNQARIDALNEQLINQLQNRRLPWRAFEQPLQALRDKANITMEQALTDGINAAMLNPGSAWQRALYRMTGALAWILPLLAALWAVYYVITSFYAGTQGEHEFLGLNFLIHASMLILLGALIPWLLHNKLKPSMAAAIRRGLKNGINTGITRIKQLYQHTWQERMNSRRQLQEDLQRIETEINKLQAEPLQELGGLMSSTKN